MSEKVVAVVSGGLDSTVLVSHLLDLGLDVSMISFDYGQRHKKELSFAKMTAQRYELRHEIVDLSEVTKLISRSVLTDQSRDVPDGHYAEETMRQTVVPNRNAIMLNIAAGWAITLDATAIATAIHAGDHYIYPDCRPIFREKISEMLKVANEGFINPFFSVRAPFITSTKGDIVKLGHALGVNWDETWSCYKGGLQHCGSCGTCFERREAFEEAGVADPTSYDSTPHFEDPR
jgi:7-cyano-7-deazaguanine synthase